MNCRALLETLTEYLDDTAAAAVRADLEAHLAECRSCTVIVETSRRTLKIVTDVGSFDIPQDLSERLLRKTMDALQETFLSVYRNIGRFKGGSSLSTWIYRIAVNAALMKMRRRKNEQKHIPIEEYMPEFDDTGHRVAVVPDWHPAVDQLLLNKELGSMLRGWIAELAPEYRTVFLLRDQEELSNEQVADILGLSVAAVKSRLHRARLYLRERAKRYVYGGA